LFGKHNWICTLRRQDLTRKSSGNRHNSNLHARSAKLIRPYDYVIGRLNGEIAPLIHDPLLYRRYKARSNSNTKLTSKIISNNNQTVGHGEE
jgi:hypothetical protein